MKVIVIHSPSNATLSILSRKVYDKEIREKMQADRVFSIGICQGTVLEILMAADIAEKTADVIAGEASGSCPQHMTCLIIIGETSAVMAAVDAIADTDERKENND